jgi:hypothetical protein
MNKKLVSFLAIISISLSLASANAAVKPGSSCVEAGLKSLVSGKTYTCIKSGNKLAWDKGVSLQTKSNTSFVQSAEFAKVEECKLLDQRKNKQQYNNTGFPLTIPSSDPENPNIIPAIGSAKAIFIPIDFPDYPGTSKFLKLMNAQAKEFTDWYSYFSNNKLQFDVATSKTWFRAPKKGSEYVIGHGVANGPNPFGKIMHDTAQEFINATNNAFNFDGVTSVLFYFPEDAKTGITNSILGRNEGTFKTPQGEKSLVYFSPGTYSYEIEKKLKVPNSRFWSLWIHELLHSQGVSLHAPGNGSRTGLGQEQEMGSAVLDVWETFLLGWLNDNQIYCLPKNQVNKQTVLLQPIEVKGSGYKTAIIPLDNHRALVVESRRPVGYSNFWGKEDSGTLIYIVDTTKDNNRSQESTGADSGNDQKFDKWAYYLVPDKRKTPKYNGRNFLESSDHRNWLMKTGDSVTFEGVKITLKSSKSKDVILVEKN